MKKIILVTVLLVLIVNLAWSTANPACGTSYLKINQFMADYYAAYNLYSQDAATIDQMDKYWAPEFISVQFLPVPQYPVMDLFTWKNFLVLLHSTLLETLVVEEMSIDTRALCVTARIKILLNDRATGALIVSVDGIAFYNLKVERGGKILITGLKLYFANPGALMAVSPPPPGF